ncbi:S8/S53 family peptidase [Salmonella enterica]|nr:S8/S53 family peptidase [Salmonella enterica]
MDDKDIGKSEPWYFDSIGMNDKVLSLTTWAPVAVSVIDSGVAFVGGIAFSEFAKYSYTKDGSPYPVEKYGQAYYIHGTSMASIIASRHDSRSVFGIFPRAMISSRRVVPRGIKDSWLKSVEAIMSNQSLTAGAEKIINVSGGEKGASRATPWTDLLSRMGKSNTRLLVAAVGNDGADIRTLGKEKRIWPASYHPSSKVNKKFDPVIRVAALAQYTKGQTPVLYRGSLTGSRYGSGWVDIGAPGVNIPVLAPDGTIRKGNGTSESAAIVSGVLAAMASCNPQASAQELKSVLLDTADKFESLADKITEGRVLNAGKAITKFCLGSYVAKKDSRSRIDL